MNYPIERIELILTQHHLVLVIKEEDNAFWYLYIRKPLRFKSIFIELFSIENK